jgi:hypothetical protein
MGSGCRKLLNVSANRITGWPRGFDGARSANHDLKLWPANGGTSRRVLTPPTRLSSEPSTGALAAAFATPGANDARRAWSMISPIE